MEYTRRQEALARDAAHRLYRQQEQQQQQQQAAVTHVAEWKQSKHNAERQDLEERGLYARQWPLQR